MEVLKKFFLLILFCILVNHLPAQPQGQLQAAFAKSYESEQAGRYVVAINDLKPVYRSDAYLVNIRLGWLYYLAKQYGESIKYYNIAISLKPYAIEAKFGCVKPLSATEQWAKVQAQYLQILKIDPQNTVANYWLGVIHYNRKEYQQAVKLFEKVVNMYPLDYDSIIMLAWTKLYMGQRADAKVLFLQALVIRPNDNSANEGLRQIK